jgi:hypothetical protein
MTANVMSNKRKQSAKNDRQNTTPKTKD